MMDGASGLTRRNLLRLGAGGLAAAGVAGAGLSGCSSQGSSGAGSGPNGPQSRGGLLRVGTVSLGSSASMDPQQGFGATANLARWMTVYDRLANYSNEGGYELGLAEEITPNATATEWTVRLREGIEFHNGKTANADDLVFTLQRLSEKESQYSLFWDEADVAGIRKVDDRTVKIPLRLPNAVFDQQAIVFVGSSLLPTDFDPERPVGTGPFKLTSIDPGKSTVFEPFANYSGSQAPFVDEFRLIEFDDDAARVNALLAGQLDAMTALPAQQVPVLESSGDYQPLIHESGTWVPITMNCSKPPFNDVRVRTAFKLMADRPQLISVALGGQGQVGNDVFGRFDPFFQGDILPQREQDIDQARALLREAGQEGVQVTLNTSPLGGGLVEAATAFAQQAKAAGVDVRINQIPPSNYYGSQFPYPMRVDFWDGTGYWQSSYFAISPYAPSNETSFNDPDWIDLWRSARRELDEDRRNSILADMQQIEHENGGYLIWGFTNYVDAVSNQTSGWRDGRYPLALSNLEFNYISV